ncbi:MAG TPA: fatty acid desaturase [Candidatus Binatia bacterium]
METAQAEKAQSAAAAIPAGVNLSLAAAHLLVNVYQLFLLPLFFLPASRWWALTLLPLALLNNPSWSLVHEAIHEMFHPSRRVNRAAGRTLALFFGAPFLVLRLSHLLHHKLNRSLVEATEVYAPEKTSKARAAAGYFAHIFGGLYLLELASPLMFFLPRFALRRLERRYFTGADLPGNLMRGLMRDAAVTEMRLDGALILILFGASAVCYGAWWPCLAGALFARAFLISFLDNVYHYATPVNDTFYARNLSLARPLSAGLLHFNLHGVHHRNPAIPWIGLPAAFRRQALECDGGYFSAALGQLNGPIPESRLSR